MNNKARLNCMLPIRDTLKYKDTSRLHKWMETLYRETAYAIWHVNWIYKKAEGAVLISDKSIQDRSTWVTQPGVYLQLRS